MHWPSLYLPLLAGAASIVSAASSWSFEDAQIGVAGKGAGNGWREKLTPNSALPKPVNLGAADTLKILLTAKEGDAAKRPHQAFLTLADTASGLEDSFVLNVKENGKGAVSITQKDLPTALLHTKAPLTAYLTLASFGDSIPYRSKAFDLSIALDPNAPQVAPEASIRYGKKPEIHHIFKSDPRSPPKIITLVFTAAVLGALPVLLGAWLMLGANVNHLSKALGAAPISHAAFFGSIVAMEGVFFMYYTSWNLFQTLPAAAAVGAVTFLSGSKALSEVQDRRLAGLR